jgi:hypothetical protein
MGLLLKFVLLSVAAYMIWNTVRRWLGLLGGPQQKPPVTSRRAPTQPPAEPAPAAAARRSVVEDTRQCPTCGAYVSVSAGKCGRPDCPQP